MQRGFGKGSIDSPFDQYCYEYGPTFNVRILFNNWRAPPIYRLIQAILSTQFKSFEKGGGILQRPFSTCSDSIFRASVVRPNEVPTWDWSF
ncbi:hypothetical protein ID866_13037 [Astraeus odoratus]|nr:hypothetical protein ID866_13037 [Astraeus odoratus]